jgi:hypothetical protein
MTPPSSHIHGALAHARDADLQRSAARPRLRPRRAFPAEAAAGASMLLGAIALVALGAPLGA